MVLGFLKMLGTASVALSGTTTSSPTARHAAATMTTTAAASAVVVGGSAAAAGAAGAGGRGEPMRVRSPLVYSFPISNLEDVRACVGCGRVC